MVMEWALDMLFLVVGVPGLELKYTHTQKKHVIINELG